MGGIGKIKEIKGKIISMRGKEIIPDFLVAALYKVETKDINRAVKHNPEKIPKEYVLVATFDEKNQLVKNFYHFNLKHSPAPIKLSTEKGLSMLDTILKIPV